MSGIRVVSYLLAQNAGVLAQVPAARIITGTVPTKTPLPALGVRKVSGIETLNVSMSVARLATERIQVTAMARTYASAAALIALAVAALPAQRGTINGVQVDSILPDLRGPDLDDPDTSIFEQSRDFLVTFAQ